MHVSRGTKALEMSVAVEDSLPAQPANGSSVYRPLGGDGWTAPHALYSTLSQLASDASGDDSDITLNLDTRFMNIVFLMEQLLVGFSSAREGEMQVIGDRPTGALHRVRMFGLQIHLGTVGGNRGLLSWNPPLIVDAESVFSQTENTGVGPTHNLLCLIYCFQKRALEKIPLNSLLASIPSVQFANVNVGT